MYSYKLEGTKKEPWSSYSTDHTKEYTDLPEGDYTFSVRLLTANGTKAVTSQLTFTVLPPWYRTWWAYSIYLILLVALAVYLFK